MVIIELISGYHCGLCDSAKSRLLLLQKQFRFAVREIKLKADHPEFAQFKNEIPVIRHNQKILASGNLEKSDLSSLIKNLTNGKI